MTPGPVRVMVFPLPLADGMGRVVDARVVEVRDTIAVVEVGGVRVEVDRGDLAYAVHLADRSDRRENGPGRKP